MYIFGGQDLKEGPVNTTWRINVSKVVDEATGNDPHYTAPIGVVWEQLNCSGKIPEPISHHNTFIFNDELYCFGGQIGSSGSSSNGNLLVLNLYTLKWSSENIN